MYSFGLKLKIIVILLTMSSAGIAEVNPQEPPDNTDCLKCHGNSYYQFYNDVIEKEVHRKMNPYFIINNELYDSGVHQTFLCVDCHLTEYETYPHEVNLKLEANYTCLDCHGEDETYALLRFDEIALEVKESVHGKLMGEQFECTMCHNPHYYELNFRNKKNIDEIVDYSNQMCLECHNYSDDGYYLLSDSIASINNTSHSWLPNQELHFKKVRCLECHGVRNDSLTISHLIKSTDNAVKKCVECHSDNTILMSSLYLHDSKELRDKYGFFNGVMLNNSFVIGANRNFYLNALSIIIFSMVILAICGHAFLRVIIKK
jgi:hypothetical protein